MRALLASLALLAAGLLATLPTAQAEEAGPYDEPCEDAVQFGCTWSEGNPWAAQCNVYRDPATGSGWGVGTLFDAGLCIFIDCLPATGCPPAAEVKLNLA